MKTDLFILQSYRGIQRKAFTIVALICIHGTLFAQEMPELSAFLEEVYESDQGIRREFMAVADSSGWDKARELYSTEMQRVDKTNLDTLELIWDEYGWLTPPKISPKAAHAQWLVVQHSPLEVQQKMRDDMIAAAEAGHMRKSNLASFLDRVALREGNDQTYGSQIAYGPGDQPYVAPLEDPMNVDKRRAEMGMAPMAEYCERQGISWSAEEYLSNLEEYRTWYTNNF